MLILRWGAERVRSLIGCCGWAGAQAQYFSQFSVIEIQSTFYDPPAAKVAARWRAMAPPDFEFCLKAWQLITHPCSSPTYRRLRGFLSPGRRQLCGFFQDTEEVWDAWKRTLEIAETVRASVILFQCPASFKATPGNIENLSRFFQKIGPQSFRLAWEPRGPWPCEVVRDLCAEHTLIHCVDPFTYSYRYSDEDLAQLKRLLYQTQAQDPAYLLFNNVSMKSDAERFMGLLTCRR
jgi:uncharacterized protein YecE (DUF72 family)